MSDRFALNRNEGTDTVHRNALEQCNLDDADDREIIDAKTAAALIASGQAVPCSHCFKTEAHL